MYSVFLQTEHTFVCIHKYVFIRVEYDPLLYIVDFHVNAKKDHQSQTFLFFSQTHEISFYSITIVVLILETVVYATRRAAVVQVRYFDYHYKSTLELKICPLKAHAWV